MQLRQVRHAIGRRLTIGCSITKWLLPRLCLLLAVVFSEIRDPIAQTANDNAQEAERLFIKGNDLLKKGDPETGLSFVRQAASKGLPKAQFQLATSLLGSETPGARAEGLRWCRESSRQLMAEARRLLVDRLQPDDPRDYLEEARPWLLGLAEQGDEHFQFKAALWLFYGTGGSRDYPQAFLWSQKAVRNAESAQDFPRANYFLGMLHENGYGTAQNYSAAARYYWTAAENGEVEAVFRLGLLSGHGQGMTEDPAIVELLYRRAAQLGMDRAQYELGCWLKQDRNGGVGNLAEAARWFAEASQNGFSPAQAQLGIAFEQGWQSSGQPDLVKAYSWFRVAAEGRHGSRTARIRAMRLAAKLSSEERQSAERRAEQLLRSISSTGPDLHLGRTNLLPAKVIEKRAGLLSATPPSDVGRPRRLIDAKMHQAGRTNSLSSLGRDDLETGRLGVYTEELQKLVADLAGRKIKEFYDKQRGFFAPMPEPREVILSFRLLSNGRVEDVAVVETNLDPLVAEKFAEALRQASPAARWTPSLRAELSDDYQELLLAFGPHSRLKIQQ